MTNDFQTCFRMCKEQWDKWGTNGNGFCTIMYNFKMLTFIVFLDYSVYNTVIPRRISNPLVLFTEFFLSFCMKNDCGCKPFFGNSISMCIHIFILLNSVYPLFIQEIFTELLAQDILSDIRNGKINKSVCTSQIQEIST